MIIKVAEVLPTGSAAKSAAISVGDQLIATSGVTYGRIDDYGGAEVRGAQQVVRLRVAGEAMKTVSAAIGSHPGHIPVTLELQKCE
jgi:predicted metalloprotease with PDZ domain